MASTNQSPSAAVRARVSHPIIDSDGHAVEFARALFECVAEVGGRGVVDRLRRLLPVTFGNFSAQQRREMRLWRGPWWALPAENTLDLATATLPKLLYERLDEIGLDFTVLYPSLALVFPEIEDEEVRRARMPRRQPLFRAILRRVQGPHGAGRLDPDAYSGGGNRRAGLRGWRDGAKGGGDAQLRSASHPVADRWKSRRRALCVLDRYLLPRQRARLRPGMGQVRRAQDCPHLSFPEYGRRLSHLDLQLHVQPHRPFRRLGRGVVQGAVHGRRDAAVPDAEVCLSGRRSRLGRGALCRPDRTLGQAQRRKRTAL